MVRHYFMVKNHLGNEIGSFMKQESSSSDKYTKYYHV